MALQTIAYLLLSPISLTESYIGGLLGPMLLIAFGTGLGFTAMNIAALTGTRRGEEGLASGLINTSRQIGGPIGLAVLLTVANFETSVGTGRLAVHSASAMVHWIWLRILGSSIAHGDRNYLYGFAQTAKT